MSLSTWGALQIFYYLKEVGNLKTSLNEYVFEGKIVHIEVT